MRDGSLVTIRPVREEDEAPLRIFLSGLCEEARRMRFFAAAIDTTKAAKWAAETDEARFGLVAHDETGNDRRARCLHSVGAGARGSGG